MGKGDLKSRRGKLVNGSYGVRRKNKKNQPAVKPAAKHPVKSAAEKVVKAPVTSKPKASPRKKKEE